jgi:hypothetical protein
MFIQVIEGKTNDANALHERLDIWERDLRPGATGYLGSTGGCTSAGDCIMVVRFESREAAERNSARPEQTAWWEETAKCFDGPVTFHDTEDVQVMTHGELDEAHFVQVMEGHVSDHDRALALESDADPMLAELRPELLGSVMAMYDEDGFTQVAYFTSEEEARQGERREMPDEAASLMAEWERAMTIDRYLDITEPWLASA